MGTEFQGSPYAASGIEAALHRLDAQNIIGVLIDADASSAAELMGRRHGRQRLIGVVQYRPQEWNEQTSLVLWCIYYKVCGVYATENQELPNPDGETILAYAPAHDAPDGSLLVPSTARFVRT